MGFFTQDGSVLCWQENQHRLWLTPVGEDAIRVQANVTGRRLDLPQAIIDPTYHEGAVEVEIGTEQASLRRGVLRVVVEKNGRIRFFNAGGAVLLEEPDPFYYKPPNRHFRFKDGRLYGLDVWFLAQEGERFWGLGQHQHGRLDNKGCVIDLQQRNTEVSIPFAVSNRGYGFLWNNPGLGRVEFGLNGTRWAAYGTQQMDYVVIAGETPAEILRKYTALTGRSPELPEFASGFWQCKLRYETQDELLAVARDYKRRGLPISVIVADFFHWSHMGDWRFDPKCWPDPLVMVRELEEMGIKLMVSIWPTVSPISENYAEMKQRGFLINNERGVDAQQVFVDHDINGPAYYAYYDATNPEAGRFVWETARRNYYDIGVRLFWLDNDEPDAYPWNPENYRYFLGNGVEVGNLYPMLHQKAFFDGLRAAGETEIVTLSRSGWAGSQRFASIIWSGDIASTFEALQAQVRAGMNMAMSGIPWWTTDIGGFHYGDITTDYFKELIVRWFQYAVFCPIFRLHGHRQPAPKPFPGTGADNEVWSFGEENYHRITRLMALRERLRPYLHKHMKIAAESGLPVMRPLFVDFYADLTCQGVEDEFMFGPEVLVAPVLHQGVQRRSVYLPAGADWGDAWTGRAFSGGQWIEAAAPLDTIPVYLKAGSPLGSIFREE